jgi:hypothetical protein
MSFQDYCSGPFSFPPKRAGQVAWRNPAKVMRDAYEYSLAQRTTLF